MQCWAEVARWSRRRTFSQRSPSASPSTAQSHPDGPKWCARSEWPLGAEIVTARRQFPFGKPMLADAERQAAMDVLLGTQLVHGPVAKGFEADFARYIGGGYATSVASCTAALHLASFYLGLAPAH